MTVSHFRLEGEPTALRSILWETGGVEGLGRDGWMVWTLDEVLLGWMEQHRRMLLGS